MVRSGILPGKIGIAPQLDAESSLTRAAFAYEPARYA